jgi:hypothetical protein
MAATRRNLFLTNSFSDPKGEVSNLVDGLFSGGVALLHAGHKTGLMCTTVLSLLSQSLILYSSWVHERNNFCVACIWLRKSEVTENTL